MKLKLLLIDDSEDDAFFFKRIFAQTSILADVLTATDGESGLQKISEDPLDCIFLDYNMPVMDGLHVLMQIRKSGINTPVIMLTGQKDDQMIVRLMLEGANDYLPKHALTSESLRLSLENSLKLYKINREKQLAEQALKVSESRLAEAQRIAQIGNWEYNYTTGNLFLSDEAKRILELDIAVEELPTLQELNAKIHVGDQEGIRSCILNFANIPFCDLNVRFVGADESIKYLNLKCRVCCDGDQQINILLGTIQDITILKKALEATRKATIKSRATTIVMSIAVFLFLISEAILDPIIDSITASLLVSLSCKGSIAVALKPMEYFLEKIMLGRV